ncbi:hypothetical protein, partial [Pseudomonas viridiflava]|uniref:hypothetical protein n=1 Tax=Pseudomonas viridiflava TaxID=33069 RepID=UPI0013DB0C72
IVDVLCAGLANKVIRAFGKPIAVNIAIDNRQIGHFLETRQVGLDGILRGVDGDPVLVDIVFKLRKIGGLFSRSAGEIYISGHNASCMLAAHIGY